MALMRVFYEDWQMECCGRPFAVGDEIGWRLVPYDEPQVREEARYGAQAWVENHGGPRRKTTGRVRSIDLVREEYAEPAPGDGGLSPVPGTWTLEPVEKCPKWFEHQETVTKAGLRRARRTSGALVTLDVPDPAQPEPREPRDRR
ncbi:DUF6578 domain-containing protein [Streptomyces sp. NPDC001843]|uniref:DUF6578 domain-containing protein n=1 Tax=Streptomyces sp. NPDC001843 TaxID=3364617 RepID=UPI0036BCBFA0